MQETLWTLMLSAAFFCATMTMTPGPNNILLTQSGANYGVKRTLPHLLGIRAGQTSLHIAILLGLGSLFESWPMLHQVLKVASIGYLIYLAYRISTSSVNDPTCAKESKPMTFKEAALFQLINPKSWMATITLCSAFTVTGDAYWLSGILGVLVYNLVGFPASFTWVFLGAAIREQLNSAKRRSHFNWTMGFLLLLTIPLIIK
ncbi:LysE family translocator [Shewanella sp. D64]|uniref:LysE family translocator n=1 Tax=unclassified Shewanella TaxID=196818 RepID=UPI0022BA6513|nr:MULTISPECIES: LysE family translocator [unclassified Shewanella]MEC4728198.1 LysE family translocator [Shewanella sp. D64]MEC4739995.1 LysE family translocator [Shewanella sp. E94]WBJ94352.1 LysE family translocator [Shewanella sp. MTB7]